MLRKYPLLLFLIPYSIGVLAFHFLGWEASIVLGLSLVMSSFALFLKKYVYLSFLLVPAFAGWGWWNAHLSSPIPLDEPCSVSGVISLNQKVKSHFYGQINDTLVLVKIKHGDFQVGDQFYFNGKIYPIQNPYEPNGFDYRRFLSKKGIIGQVYLKADVHKLDHPSLRYYLNSPREFLLSRIKSGLRDIKVRGVVSALILGEKEELPDEIKSNFSQSGVMHVLAVSGLHVGFVYLIIQFLLKRIGIKRGPKLFFTIVGFLWFYAFLTGLSPSVVRAALMISIYLLGQLIQRRVLIQHALLGSATLLLLIKPNMMFEVGFQLSFGAVLGIVFFFPLFQNLRWWPTQKVLKQIADILGVSLAAQLGTLPLTIFYFQTFQPYFLFGNLLIIPLISILMPLGICTLLVSLFWNSEILWVPVKYGVLGIVKITEFISALPQSQWSFDMRSWVFSLGLFLFIWFGFFGWKSKKLVFLFWGVGWFILGSFTMIQDQKEVKHWIGVDKNGFGLVYHFKDTLHILPMHMKIDKLKSNLKRTNQAYRVWNPLGLQPIDFKNEEWVCLHSKMGKQLPDAKGKTVLLKKSFDELHPPKGAKEILIHPYCPDKSKWAQWAKAHSVKFKCLIFGFEAL